VAPSGRSLPPGRPAGFAGRADVVAESASPGIGPGRECPPDPTLGATEGDVTTDAQSGFGLEGALGKESWIGGHWGLGVAGQFFLGLNADAAAPGSFTWTTLGGSVAFSATYN
jgi:hypothetical protein